MNKDSCFTASKWANGQPSIEIDPYDYSTAGFMTILETLQAAYPINLDEAGEGLEAMIATVFIKNEKVDVIMDNWTCSLAFQSEQLRDEILNFFKTVCGTPLE